MTTGRRTIALTNSRKAGDPFEVPAVVGHGWCHNIHVDADLYERWLANETSR